MSTRLQAPVPGSRPSGRAAIALPHLAESLLLTRAINSASPREAPGWPPWQACPIEVDGTIAEALLLDLDSDALPAGTIGPALLAVFRIGAAEVTVIADNRDVEMIFTEISAQDLLGMSGVR